MKTLWEYLKDSTILQAILTIEVVTAVIYFYATDRPVPDFLLVTASTIVGYYFGVKLERVRSGGDTAPPLPPVASLIAVLLVGVFALWLTG